MKCLALCIISAILICLCQTVLTEKVIRGASREELEEHTVNDNRILKRSLREAYESHLAMLQEAEQSLTKQIEELKARREELSSRKRSHVMCLVNLISCFRKR
ncbi:hypothetical protein SNE40_015485 [Patella caerulea]|uniref:Uncharacterized protein n=1 Tax=Patella caerulea TaxID=87958 RepID=A0AAN8PS39_PATCE